MSRQNNDPMIGIGGAPTRSSTLPTDPAERKKYPLATGCFDYFPDALAAIANVSWQGNEQHNPGQPLHWARGKSMDEADTCLRHFSQRGTLDTDGKRHSAKAAWRMLAILQKEIEAECAESSNGVGRWEPTAAECRARDFRENLVNALKAEGLEVLDDHNADRIEHELAQQVQDDHGQTHYVVAPENRMGAARAKLADALKAYREVEESNTPDDRYMS